ncbi:MAG TPA: pepsin/retropepsin-like aspartic protease family protein [Bryobacteraceae bacterium]|nr:pepsin/retropepsin-like aspartic protease family protein [Bryobacteraceae bacterium]
MAQSSGADLTKEQLLDHWAAALGGREKLQKLRAVHTQGTIETGGVKGTFERWSTWRGEFHMTIDLGGAIHQENIFDGKQGWAMDASGSVHDLSGGNLRSAISSAYEASESFFFAGRLAGEIVFIGRDAAQFAYVIRLEPAGGNPVTVFLDENTLLPKREETMGPLGNKRTLTIVDWLDSDGIKFPARTVQSSGDAKFDITTTVERVDTNPTLAANLFTRPAEAAAQFRFANGAHQTTVPVEVYGEHIFLPVRVNGEMGWFFLDSGAGSSVVTKEFAQKIQLASNGAMRAVGANGATSLAIAKNVVLGLPNLDFPLPSVTVLDSAAALPSLGREWNGLLGYDVFSRLVVRVDYQRKQVTFADPAFFDPQKPAASLPLSFLGNWPLVPVKIVLPSGSPIETKCFLDTGAGGLMLSNSFAAANALTSTNGAGSILGTAGETKRVGIVIAELQLGPYVLRDLNAGLAPGAKEGALASPDIGALAGGEILRRFVVTFDYPHHRVLLEPAPE